MNQPKTKPIHRRGAVCTAYCNCNAHFLQTIAILIRPISKKHTNNEGITLVSLVVTIIILLILAGVTLALISGSDGILGRATKAVDKHKIAEIKEKVELKVAEDVEQFHEEKYVDFSIDNAMSAYAYLQEKTTKTIENGNEQYTIKYTNSADPQDPDANKIQVDYAKKNMKITVNGSISQSGVINWEEDGTVGSSGENSGGNNDSGEDESGGGGSSTGSGNISSEELAKLKEGMEQLQGEVSNLKNQLGTTNNALETTKQELQTTKDNLNSILTSQTRKDVLYESTEASQTGKKYNFTFPSGKSLGSYKMLIFYADAYSSASGTNYWCLNDSTMVEPKVYDKQYAYHINFCEIQNDKVDPKNWWNLYFSIPNENQFRIDGATRRRLLSSCENKKSHRNLLEK